MPTRGNVKLRAQKHACHIAISVSSAMIAILQVQCRMGLEPRHGPAGSNPILHITPCVRPAGQPITLKKDRYGSLQGAAKISGLSDYDLALASMGWRQAVSKVATQSKL